LVVSLVPNFNKVMYEALRDELPGVPYVTVLTDMADYPPHFWMEPRQDQYIVCGTAYAASQAAALGYAQRSIITTSGMILRPDFYRRPIVDKAARLAELGLQPHLPTGLIMFGGHGSAEMLQIAKALPDRQLIFVAGHNTALVKKMAAQSASTLHHVMNFVKDIYLVMHLCDYFVGKPGPGSLSEAVHMGLPVITFRNASTMPQERYNTVWLEENRLGKVIASVSELSGAVEALLSELPLYHGQVQQMNNQAVFEVVDALGAIKAG
jgi:UDP-N-acetylglucosamine:LPS N-acetylglucosamine transferase